MPLPCRILAGLLVFILALPPHLLANPQGGQVRQGQVRIDASPGQLRIHQQSQRAVIDWESFSIDRGEVTRFLQPNASAAALNRVRGDSASRIEGMLRANGNVYLINPNGILVGPSGTIDVGGFVGSTLDTADDDFMRGGDLRFSGHGDAAIINLGSISALDGDVVLMAGSVLNAGTIRAPRGTAALAAGNDILLAESGEERVFVRGSGGSRKAEGVTNTGEIEANIAELKAHGGNLYGMAVKNEGRVAATGVTRSGGQIFLSAGGGKVRSTGSLKAKKSDGSGGRIKVDSGTTGETEIGGTVDASSETGSGGEIVILGNEIEVFDGTLILNDGETGGGRTFIGGGRHGADASLANATNLSIGGGSLISANARGTGDGGEIVLFATDTASVHGLVSAQGGAYGGDGGFIELSGQGRLYVPDLVGQVRLSAPLGASGTLLLDPANINVIHGTGGGIMGTTMTDGALMDVLANFPVLIWTSDYGVGGDGDITFAADVNVTWSSPYSLTFQADRDLIFLGGARINATGGGSFTGTAERSVSVGNGASISTASGTLTLSGNAGASTTGQFRGIHLQNNSTISSGTGTITLTGRGGNSILTGNHGIDIESTAVVSSLGGNIFLDGRAGTATGAAPTQEGALIKGNITNTGNGNITIAGTGGNGTSGNLGVHLFDNVLISTVNGDISITGVSGPGTNSPGIQVADFGSSTTIITSTSGDITLSGDAGSGPSEAITIFGTGASIGGGSGAVELNATGDLRVYSNASVTATGAGTVTLDVTRRISLQSGAAVTGVNGDLSLTANNSGSAIGSFSGIDLDNALIRSDGNGSIFLTGRGGDSGDEQHGVRLRNGADILGGTGGLVSVTGYGGSSNGLNHQGILLTGIGTSISSSGADVALTGTGGAGSLSSGININQASVTAGVAGDLTLHGIGGATTNGAFLHGVYLYEAFLNTAGGNVSVTGEAGSGSSAAGDYTGVHLDYSTISAGGSGTVEVTGTGGSAVDSQTLIGVDVRFDSQISSSGGNVTVIGTGGNTNHVGVSNGAGVRLIADGTITAGGTGSVSVTGTGVGGTSAGHEGVVINGSGFESNLARIGAANGLTTITAISGNSSSHALVVGINHAGRLTTGTNNPITIHADSISIGGQGIVSSGTGDTTILPRTAGTRIDLGGGDVLGGSPLTLGLTDAELDRITAGTLFVGNGSSGPLTISSALTHGNHLTLATGGSVTINAGLTLAADKNLLIEASDFSAGTISLATANADLGTSGSGSVTIEAGRNLVLSPGSSITSVNGAISLTANRGPYPASGSLIGMDLESATVTTTGTGAITLSGHGGDATGDQNGIRLRGGTSLATNGGNLTLLGEASDPLSSGIRIDLASLTSGGGVLELEGTGGNTSIDSPDTNATIGAPGDTVIVKSTSGAVGLFSQVRGYRLQLQDLGGADALDFTLNNSNNDIDQFNTLGNGPNGRIGTLVFREANGFHITDFLGGSGVAATGFLDLRATRFSGSSIVIDAPVTSQGGNITIVGRDVVVDGTEITTIGGGSLELNAGRAILVQGDSLLSVTDGELSVTAHQDEFYTTGTFTGLTILGSRVQSLGTGTIALYGKGGNGGTGSDFAYSGFTNPSTNGVRLDGGTVIASSHPSSSDFTVSIVGVGGLGASDSVGVVIANPDTIVSAASGALLIEGFGGGQSTGQRNRGVLFTGGHIQATNLANITLYGAGGSGVNENDGIQLNSGARISAANGDMILDGYAGETLGIGVLLGNTAGNLSITGTGTVTVQGEGTNADGIVLGNAGALVGGTNAGFVELQSTGDLRVQRELLASGGIFLNASAGGTIVDGEIHSTNGNIAIEGDDVTINAEVTADDGNIEIIFGDQPLIGESEPEVEAATFNGTAAINDLLTASGWVRYYGGDGGGDLLTFAGYTASGVDLDFGTLFDVEQVVGSGSSDDRLTGPSVASTYSFTGANVFQVGGVDFSAFENVLGGAANDTFAFSGSATLSGSLDGGGGTNTLDYTSYGTGVIIDLENGAATGIIGGFENIATFTGSGNIDTITGPGSASTYTFTGPDAMQVGSVSVSGFENVIAGPLEDEFVFLPGSRISGTLDGGSSPTPVVNRLNYAGYGAPVTVNLGTAPLSATGIAGGFSNINQFLGSALATDRFIGPQTATAYQITGANTFSSAAFTASGFENLTGGIGSDTFAFAPGAALGGRLSGGTSPGVDTLDYSAFGRAVTVNIGPNTATGIGGGFLDLERIIGSSGNDRFNFLNQATISFVDGGGGTDLLEINDSTLRGENTYDITANSVSRNPLYTFNNFESLRLFLGSGNNTVNSDFFGYTQFIHGGAGYNTLNLPGISSLNQGNPIRNVYHYGIDAPRPDGNDTGGLLQLEVNQQNRGPNTGQGFDTENRFSIVDPGTLSQQIGALSGAFAAAITAQASLIVVDGNPYLVFRPFSLDGSGITPSNLAIGALNESLGVDANLELAAAIGYTGPLFLFNPDGPLGLDLSGAPIDPAILTVLQESLAIAAASELSAAIGLNLVVSIVPTDGISPIALDGSAPGQSIVLLLSDQLGDAAQNELQAAIGTN